VGEYAKEPRPKRTGVVETADSVERAHERVLHQILCVVRVAGDASRDDERPIDVAAYERVECGHVASLDPGDDRALVFRCRCYSPGVGTVWGGRRSYLPRIHGSFVSMAHPMIVRGRPDPRAPKPPLRERLAAMRLVPRLIGLVWETHRGYTAAMIV